MSRHPRESVTLFAQFGLHHPDTSDMVARDHFVIWAVRAAPIGS
jgi:hypothetical protein